MIETVRLKNGLRMVFEELSHVKSASVGIWVRAGSINEMKKNSGISHFIEHMMFKGTDRSTDKRFYGKRGNLLLHKDNFRKT